MLEWIKIKNLALIRESDVEFGEGFNVITGETGAGKSVLLSTITLLLGARADKGVIRTGAERCEVSAGISLNRAAADRLGCFLEECAIPFDGEEATLQLRREITQKRTRNFINDVPVTLGTLKKLGESLIDIHGPNDNQSLLKPLRQLETLDRYAGLEDRLKKCAQICAEIRAVNKRRKELEQKIPSRIESEHLQMIVAEIDRVAPEPDEDKTLAERHRVAASAKTIMETVQQTVMQLNEGDNSINDQLAAVYRSMEELEQIDPEKTAGLLERCGSINESVRELAYELEDYGSRVELNEEEFQELEERISALETLKRRYGPGLDNVLQARDEAERRLEAFHNAANIRNQLDEDEKQLKEQLQKNAAELSSRRRKVAKQFCGEVIEKLHKLGFLKSSLSIAFSAIEPGERGCDYIEFMFSANPGEAERPLRDIASSGEISRVMLALKTVLADADSVPILIFDEVDVNIGGQTAFAVADELRALAGSRQLLCISHLAQVASRAHSHFLVEKTVSGGRTDSHINELSEDQRITEIARMLGGGNAATAHAMELLDC